MSLRRRDLVLIGGLGGGIGLIGAAGWSVGKLLGARAARTAPLPGLDIDCTGASSEGSAAAGYSAKFVPAAYFAGDRDGVHIPPARTPFSTHVREFDLSVIETTLHVARGQNVKVLAYGGTLPGPSTPATVR